MLADLRTTGWRAALLVLAVTVVYAPALRAGFVWDDDTFLTENPLIHADDGLRRFWLSSEASDYFPLASTSLWLEWRIWGDRPAGYHATNVALHAASTLVLWRILSALGVPCAWLAALCFGIHPVNVESVAWITQRKNTLCMFFFLLGVLAYLRYDKKGDILLFEAKSRMSPFLLALAAHTLALLSKTAVVGQPVVLLLCLAWRHGRIPRGRAWSVLPFFLVSGVLGLVTVWFQGQRAIGPEVVRQAGAAERLADAGRALWFYLGKALLPLDLSFVYPRWTSDAGRLLHHLPWVAAVATGVVLYRYRKAHLRAPALALAYYVVMLLPVLGFLDIYFMRYSLVADHYQYFALPGLVVLVVGGVGAWSRKGTGSFSSSKRCLSLFPWPAAAAVVALGWLTHAQAGLYQDAHTLWRSVCDRNPSSWLAHNELGRLLASRDDDLGARSHLEQALRLRPDYAEAHNNLGIVLARQGLVREALRHFEESLRLAPGHAGVRSNLERARAAVAAGGAGEVPGAGPAERSARLDGRPVRLMDGVYALGQFPPVCLYLLEADDGLVLVDAGYLEHRQAIRQAIRSFGLDPGRIRHVLLTHLHLDHSMALDAWRRETGAAVYAGAADAEALESGASWDLLFPARMLPQTGPMPAVRVDVHLRGEQRLPVPGLDLRAIATPGHTRGSTSYLLIKDGVRVLLAGDTLMTMDGPLGTYTAKLAPRYGGDAAAYLETLRRLSRLDVDLLLPGHLDYDPEGSRSPPDPWVGPEGFRRLARRGIDELEVLLQRHQADGLDFLDERPRRIHPGLLYLGMLGPTAGYALEAPEGLVLVDPGPADQAGTLLRRLADFGHGPEAVAAVLLTRLHPDLSGAVTELAGTGDLQVYCPAEEVQGLGGLPGARGVAGGANLRVAGLHVEACATPAHGGGLTWLVELDGRLAAFTGDAVRAVAGNGLVSPPASVAGEARRTLLSGFRELQDRPVGLWLPAHPFACYNANVYDHEWGDTLRRNIEAEEEK